MSVDNFIPEIWTSGLLSSYKNELVYGSPMVINRNYEGQIRQQGDTVRITSVSRPTIDTYVPNTTTITPERLNTAQRTLVITESKYFAFEIDDVDRRQIAGDVMTEALDEAGYGLAETADSFISALYTGAQTANQIGTVGVAAGTPTAAYDNILVPLMVALNEASVPKPGRYCIIPPWLTGRLVRDDRFVRADASASTEALRNGVVGRASGFTIMESNTTPNPTSDHNVVMAGVNAAITFADQINDTEAYRPESSFSDAIKGLHVYGAKLIRPEGIATAIADPTP